MADAKQRELAETIFNRNQVREAKMNNALKQEEARHAALVENLYRLRALRLERNAKQSTTNN